MGKKGDPVSGKGIDEYGMYAPSSTRSRSPASFTQGDRPPSVRRDWRSVPVGENGFNVKRTKAGDFIDKPNTASLWSQDGQDNFLFSRNTARQIGDQLILGVQKDLQIDISYELHQATAKPEKDKSMRSVASKKGEKGKDGKKEGGKTEEQIAEEKRIAQKKEIASMNFVDKIPVYIIENFGVETFRIKGQKEVVFKGQRRRVEVIGLIRKMDITKNDIVQSAKLLDHKVKVLN
jgi:flagellar basal body L-ring protein FlgH